MAETTSTEVKKTSTKKATAPKVQVEPEELNLDEKVNVRSIAGWNTGFARKVDGFGDINIMPKGTVRLSRNEIIAQIQSGNRLFTGTDEIGSHATLIIDDKPTKIEVGFETENSSQKVFSDELMLKLFDINSTEEFQMKFKECIKTRAEKYASIDAIQRLKLNDYSKIRFVEGYTGYKMM